MSQATRRYPNSMHLARQLGSDQRGVAMIITALALVMLLGFCGLAVDVVMWEVSQRTQQGAADQAALAAATAFRNAGDTGALGDSTSAQNAAYATANRSGYPTGVTVAPYTNGTSCTAAPGTVAPASGAGCLKVTITQQQQRYFTGIFSGSPVIATVSAVGTCSGCGGGSFAVGSTGGDPCVMALDANGAGIGSDISGDVTLKGGAVVSINHCNLYNNSPFTDATVSTNNSLVEGCDSTDPANVASCGSRAFLAQPTNPNGTCTPTATTTCPIDVPVVTNAAPAPNPYGGILPPTDPSVCGTYNTCGNACNDMSSYYNAATKSYNNVPSGTYCPGPINGVTVNFADNAVIVLKPPLSGGNQNSPGLDTEGNNSTSLNGTHVALYVLGGGKVTANATLGISAPVSGPYQGLAVWFGDSTAVSYSGSNAGTFQGAIYAPTANVSYSGNGGSQSTCTRLVAGSITFTGGATANFDNSTCPTVSGPVLSASGVTGSTTYTGSPMLIQ